MKDFELRIRPDKIDNPHGLSAFDQKPKYQIEREKELAQKEEAMRKFMLAGKPHDWI